MLYIIYVVHGAARRDVQMATSVASPCEPNKPVCAESLCGSAEKSTGCAQPPTGPAKRARRARADDQLFADIDAAAVRTREVLRAPRRTHRVRTRIHTLTGARARVFKRSGGGPRVPRFPFTFPVDLRIVPVSECFSSFPRPLTLSSPLPTNRSRFFSGETKTRRSTVQGCGNCSR